MLLSTREVPPAEIRRQREAAGLSTREFAQLLDVSPALVQHWEAGRRPVPRGRVSDLQRVLSRLAPAPPVAAMAGEELRALRQRAQLSQGDVAHLLGVKRQAVALWEAGEVPEARREMLREVLAADVPSAALLRALRQRAGWKQAELGERAGVDQRTVSSWERGELPIPRDRWPAIRELLEEAEPDIRPAHFQPPVTREEMRAGRQRLGWPQSRLAHELGVATSVVGHWEAGIKPVPAERRAQVREVLGTAAPAPSATPRDRVAEALPLVLAVIEAEPGLQRSEVIRRVDAPEPYARGAVVRALETDEAHERQVPRRRPSDGAVQMRTCLFPGRRPAELPKADPAELVVDEAVVAIVAEPGRTRRQVAEALPHGRGIGERAVAHALAAGQVHERAVLVSYARGPRAVLGIFPGEPPAPAPAITGSALRQMRARLVLGQAELAELLDVGPDVLRRWEAGEVPEAWRQAVADALRHATEAYRERTAERCQRIVAAVAAEPGQRRWGALSRQLRHVERPLLGEVLDELVAAGELHERPVDGQVGLFVGPPPPEWEPGEPISAEQLQVMREWSGLSQRELARRIGASTASVNAWEQGTKPVPPYRRPQLRRVLAERKPPEPPPIPADELRAERWRVGWTQTELGRRVGVDQAAVAKWERGEVAVPAARRERVRAVLAAAPTAPRVSGAELRRWQRAQDITSGVLAERLGLARTTVFEWRQRGVSADRAAEVRALIDASTEPAQRSLFE